MGIPVVGGAGGGEVKNRGRGSWGWRDRSSQGDAGGMALTPLCNRCHRVGPRPPGQRPGLRQPRATPWVIVPKYKKALKGRPRQPSHPHALPNRTSPLMKLPGAR